MFSFYNLVYKTTRFVKFSCSWLEKKSETGVQVKLLGEQKGSEYFRYFKYFKIMSFRLKVPVARISSYLTTF